MTSDSQLMDSRDVDSTEENENAKEDVAEQWEKGYDLPIDEPERKEAEDECKMILELISDIYTQADKGEAVNTVLDDKTIYKMQDRIKEKGYPVITMKAYAAMENYKKVEDFLKNCQEEKAGFIVLYELQSDGGIGRDKFIFDGKDMYLISACATWNTNDTYGLSYISYAQKAFDAEDYSNGIPKEEFESLIMEYLPVTAEQIQEYAVFDEKNQTYVWVRLGCLNYAPTFFGTSLPEVIDIKENEDGTVTLTVDAVCDMVICDDAVITHELTVKFADDGSFQYLGNKILDDGIKEIPAYQYRIKE